MTALLTLALAAAAPAAADSGPTRVVVLGVDHSAQLVSSANRPGLLAAFLDRVRPDAVCVERPPDRAARGDWYEFTYEVQGIVVPWASAHGVPLCPIDWMPSVEDQLLAFGMDLDIPPDIRPEQGFQAFLVFPDSASLSNRFFAAEDSATLAPSETWARTAQPADRDFSRRLFLYRTFLQARRVRAAAHAHPGGTVLVVVGYFHKADIERVIGADPAIRVVAPAEIGLPTEAEADRATTHAHRAAILSFNLLGRQSETGIVDWPWVGRVLAEFEREAPGPEAALFRTRYELLTKALAPTAAAARYAGIRDQARETTFTWTGVKDRSRLDSYFDRFGNLTVGQRAAVELARVLVAGGDLKGMFREGEAVAATLGARKALQLDLYFRRFPGFGADTVVLGPRYTAGNPPPPELNTAQAPGYFRFLLGDFEVTALNDGVIPYASKSVLPTATAEQIGRGLHAAGLTDPVGMSYNGFLINTGSKLVLIDVGTGGILSDNPGFRGAGRLLANLRDAGYSPEQVDEIYISHFGPDHIGALTTAEGMITFPNATVRVSVPEFAAFVGDGNLTGPDSTRRRFYAGFFEPYRRTGRFLPFEQDTILIPGIRSLATPGHTPGHTSFLVESRGQTLLVLGDLVHLGALQFADPSLVTSFDGDRAGGAAQRARIFSLAANQNLWVAGAHLPFPGIGHLRTDGNGYRWAPIDYPIPR